MATPASGRKVAETCVELLQIELVDYILNSPKHAGREKTYHVLENLGFQVGQRLAERYTRDKPRFSGDLEVIKFLCKEFWMDTFKRQIDNLKTNHRGTFVLTDSKFRWLSRISAQTIDETQEAAAPFIIFPTGIIRGALSVLGVNAMVSAEVEFSQHSTPSCQFKVQVKPN